MLNCIIIDDEQHAINVIDSYVKNIPYLNLIATTTNAIEGINIVNEQNVDLVFLDIQMPTISGLEFIKTINGKSKVIIISGTGQYALEGFELEVIDYILKPVSFGRFLKAVQKALVWHDNVSSYNTAAESEFIMLKGNARGTLIKVEIDDIDYIEGSGNYITIFYANKKIISLTNLKDLEDNLGSKKFVRVHKSFIIAVSKIASIECNSVTLKNHSEIKIPIGNAYREPFLKMMKKRLVN